MSSQVTSDYSTCLCIYSSFCIRSMQACNNGLLPISSYYVVVECGEGRLLRNCVRLLRQWCEAEIVPYSVCGIRIFRQCFNLFSEVFRATFTKLRLSTMELPPLLSPAFLVLCLVILCAVYIWYRWVEWRVSSQYIAYVAVYESMRGCPSAVSAESYVPCNKSDSQLLLPNHELAHGL